MWKGGVVIVNGNEEETIIGERVFVMKNCVLRRFVESYS
jgi:hypothetical protein